MSAKCRAWSKFGKDATPKTLPKVAFCAGWDAAMDHRVYAENKQLKDELELLSDDYDLQCQCRDGYRMNNVRLREALEKIASINNLYTTTGNIARAALDI